MADMKLAVKITGDGKDLKAAIQGAKGDLGGLENKAVKSGGLSSEAFRSLAASVRTAGAAAVGAAAAFSIVKATQFSAAMADLSAITGATGKQLQYLETQAKNFGSTTTLSASEAAEAFKLIASAKPDLLDNAQALSEVTGEVIKLAEASGVELAFAADAVGASLNQFGAEADQAARFVNVLAAGSKFGSSSVNDTAVALKNVGSVAAGAGLSFEQTNAAIQTLAKVGIKGGEAGTGLRAVLLKLSSQSKREFNPEIVGLAKAMENVGDASLTTAEKTKLFGLESITSANALIQEAAGMNKLTEQITATNTAYDQAHTRNDNLAGDMKALSSATEGAAISFGQIFLPVLRDFIQAETEGIQGLTSFINVLSNADDQLALAVQIGDLDERLNDLKEKGLVMSGEFLSFSSSEAAIQSMEAELKSLTKRRNDLISPNKADNEEPRDFFGSLKKNGNIDAYYQAIEAGASKAEARLIALAQKRADMIEEAHAATQSKGASPLSSGETDKQKAARLAKEEAQNNKIINLAQAKFDRLANMEVTAIMGEEDRTIQKYDAKLLSLETEKNILVEHHAWTTEQKTLFAEAEKAIEAQKQDDLAAIKKRGMDKYEKLSIASGKVQLKNSLGLLKDLTAGASTQSRAMFNINKAASLASATVSGIEAVQHSYKSGAAIGGPIVGAAFAGVAVAATLANLKKIESTTFGGGGKAGAAGGGASIPSQALDTGAAVTPTTQDAPQQTVNVYFQGNVLNEQYVNEVVVPMIQDGVTNGDLMLIAPDSANASVLAAA